jgi:hypothetical protein
LPQARMSYRKQRNFSASEKSVDRDEDRDHQKPKWGIGHRSENNSIGIL